MTHVTELLRGDAGHHSPAASWSVRNALAPLSCQIKYDRTALISFFILRVYGYVGSARSSIVPRPSYAPSACATQRAARSSRKSWLATIPFSF